MRPANTHPRYRIQNIVVAIFTLVYIALAYLSSMAIIVEHRYDGFTSGFLRFYNHWPNIDFYPLYINHFFRYITAYPIQFAAETFTGINGLLLWLLFLPAALIYRRILPWPLYVAVMMLPFVMLLVVHEVC